MELTIFWVLALVAIGSAANILYQRRPLYSAFSLIVTFLALAGVYMQMKAEFIAVMQVVIYTGAIMVLFVFVIMLLNARDERHVPHKALVVRYIGAPLVLLLVLEIGMTLFEAFSGEQVATSVSPAGSAGNAQAIGKLLFTRYALPFELTSVLLLVAIVGAILLAKKEL